MISGRSRSPAMTSVGTWISASRFTGGGSSGRSARSPDASFFKAIRIILPYEIPHVRIHPIRTAVRTIYPDLDL